MKTKFIAEQSDKLPKSYKMPILATIDSKVENDMNKVIQKLDAMEHSINTKFDAKFDAMNAKYNVLIGMISFVGFVITVITIVTQLKG